MKINRENWDDNHPYKNVKNVKYTNGSCLVYIVSTIIFITIFAISSIFIIKGI